MATVTKPSTAALRSEIAAKRIKRYMLAAQIGVHPVTLSGLLNDRFVMTDELAARIKQGIENYQG